MKKFSLLFIFIFLIQFAKSQNNKDAFEFGSTLFTLNSLKGNNGPYQFQGKPPYEIMNGILFRYHFKRFALRFSGSYSDFSHKEVSPPEMADGGGFDERSKDFRLGCGAQYNLLKTKDWLYLFADVLYRNINTEGIRTEGFSGQTVKYTTIGRGTDSFLGVGAQVKLYKNLYFSPELAFNISALNTRTNDEVIGPVSTFNSYSGSTLYAHHVIKLHLSVRF